MRGVHISGRVNEIVRIILSLFMFFYEKVYENAQKRKSNQNQQTKQKQANKKNKGNSFSAQNVPRGGKLLILRFLKKLKLP